MPQFDWLCDVCGCVMSPTLGIYWVELDFINNCKEPQLYQSHAQARNVGPTREDACARKGGGL